MATTQSTIELKMGKYLGRRNVANKEYHTTWVTTLNVTPFGEFNPRNAQFCLENLYQVNYGYFKFNGVTFWGYIDVSVHTKGYYIYTFTVDGLTTAYKNGCFNTNVFVEYCDLGDIFNYPDDNQLILDKRAQLTPQSEKLFYQIANSKTSFYIIINVSTGDFAPSSGTSGNPSTISYVLTSSQYNDFLNSLSDAFLLQTGSVANAYLKSIVSTYVIPQAYVLDDWLEDISKVLLGGFIETSLELTPLEYNLIEIEVPNIKYISHLKDAYDIDFMNTSISFGLPSGVVASTVLSGVAKLNTAVVKMHAEFIGDISFRPFDYGITDASGFGYKVVPEFGSGMIRVYPLYRKSGTTVNTIVDRTLQISSKLAEMAPEISVSGDSMTLFKQLLSFGSSALVGVAQGNYAAPVISAFSTGADMLLNASGNNNVQPVLGGSLDRASHQGGYMYLIYNDYVNYTNFFQLFGGPYMNWINLSNVSFNNVDGHGYCQTRNCQLQHSGGVPDYVIEEANRMLDAGAYIGSANMP